MKLLRCSVCGNIIVFMEDSGMTPMCCGKPMENMEAGTSDGSAEKHVPSVKCDCDKDDGKTKVKVRVGETPHPMESSHYIQWIMLETCCGFHAKRLEPGTEAVACFRLSKGEKPLRVYEYCNVHGLWVKNIDCE